MGCDDATAGFGAATLAGGVTTVGGTDASGGGGTDASGGGGTIAGAGTDASIGGATTAGVGGVGGVATVGATAGAELAAEGTSGGAAWLPRFNAIAAMIVHTPATPTADSTTVRHGTDDGADAGGVGRAPAAALSVVASTFGDGTGTGSTAVPGGIG
jgi:hypothetical protein